MQKPKEVFSSVPVVLTFIYFSHLCDSHLRLREREVEERPSQLQRTQYHHRSHKVS
jgi:hypothetical protein